MQIVVKASPEQKAILESMQWAESLQLQWFQQGEYMHDAVAYFDFCFEEEGWEFKEIIKAPVFVNAVCVESNQLPANAIRMNAWNSFLNRSIWEIAAKEETLQNTALEILLAIGRKGIKVPDEPGLIAARVIAMIINEAYFALGEEISTKQEIDIAMRLGTNYPYGPFEWAELIGLPKIARLLEQLYLKDDRYAIAPKLLQELNSQITDSKHGTDSTN
ncbi:MAG: 3-hydroxyacyl-CoA dehydrogenase family protein [Bacteroidota bacterium]